jgi:hypothetical protein
MGKVLKPLAFVAGIALQVIPGVGNAVGGLLLSAGLGAASASAVLGLTSLALIGIGTSGGRRAPTLTAFDPKSINPDPNAPRMIVLGRTVFPVVLRHGEPSGANQEYVDYVFRLASHKSDAIEEIWIEDKLAWTAAGGAQGIYAGYLTVEVILEAGPAAFHTVNDGTKWGSHTRLTGSTTMKVRVKRSDNNKNSQSPFASGISGRWAVIGRGMPVYDPALDSTVPGGSGSQRANDNSTWAYTAGITRGNNLALQLLAFLLGWKINGEGSVGCGLSPDVIGLPSFAAAAAICDEPAALAGGGSQRRFEGGRAFSDNDDPKAVIAELLKAMNGELVDDGGLLQLRIAINDLTPALTLTDDDFVGGYDWRPQPDVAAQFTVVRGSYSEPAAPSLFSMVAFPQVAVPRTSLVPRTLQLDLGCVQDQRRAERIAKQAAQRSLYAGEFEVTLGIRGWLLTRNMVVRVDSAARGWVNRLFRVRELTFNADGTVSTLLQEENAAIYAWDASESPLVQPVTPVPFDSRAAASWLMANIEPEADVTATATPSLDALPGVTFQANHLGVLASGQLPRTVQATRRRGPDNVSATTTWTLETVNCAATISSTGLITITDVSSTGRITVISVRDGVELRGSFDVIVQLAPPPVSGGSGGTSASTSSFTSPPGGNVWTDITGDLTITIGTAGEAALAAPLVFFPNINFPDDGFYTYGAELRWRRETSPGVWATVGAEASQTREAFVDMDSGNMIDSSTGAISCNRTATGLTSGSTQTFRLQARAAQSNYLFGTAAAVGS